MGKYEPLSRYLSACDGESWSATFKQIEDQLGFPLPRSAREHRAWWSNQKGGNHSQAAGWQNAGWETRDVDLKRGVVRFERRRRQASPANAASAEPARVPLSDLWRRASELTGIEDRDKLTEAALLALMHREASRQLAAMGGTMPEFEVPPRERPTW